MTEEILTEQFNEEEMVEETTADTAVEEQVDAPEAKSEDSAPLTLEEQLEAAKAEAARNMDGWLRSQAEFANARKRFEKLRADSYNNATAAVLSKILPALDDYERALETAPENIREDSWFEGILLVQRKLNNVLEGFQVTPIEAVGEPFDPNLHEAIMQEESDEHESGVVTRELQKGYKQGDRVIRPAMVYVAA